MINISCQQLTENMHRIQKFRKEYLFSSDNRTRLVMLQEMKSYIGEVLSNCLVSVEIMYGKILKVFYPDYKIFNEFEKLNLGLKVLLSTSCLDENHRICCLNISGADIVSLELLKDLKDLREIKFYSTKIEHPESIISLQGIEILTLYYAGTELYNYLGQLPLLKDLIITGGGSSSALKVAEIPSLKRVKIMDPDRSSPFYQELIEKLKKRKVKIL